MKSWDFCDRSPCTRLIEALGKWIYGKPDDGSYVAVSPTLEISEIRYCPFCGIRLAQLELKAGQLIELPDSKTKGKRQ